MKMNRIVKYIAVAAVSSMLMLTTATGVSAKDPKISPTREDVPPATADNMMNPMIPIGTGAVFMGLGCLVIYGGKKRIEE